jgi:microcystin-dependent protein
VINGELIPFEGGAKKTKITIQQTSKTLTAFGVDYSEAYIYRSAKFSDTGEYTWSDFVQVLTNKQLQQRVEAITGDVPGIVKKWPGRIEKIPRDYMLCDGSILSIEEYPHLFDNLGSVFGGNGIDSFAIPDLRSRFIVGYSGLGDYNTIGATGGEDKHLLTVGEMPSHTHGGVPAMMSDTDRGTSLSNFSLDTSGSSSATGGNETHENRPPYFVLAYIIKVK